MLIKSLNSFQPHSRRTFAFPLRLWLPALLHLPALSTAAALLPKAQWPRPSLSLLLTSSVVVRSRNSYLSILSLSLSRPPQLHHPPSTSDFQLSPVPHLQTLPNR
ncbi:hypothetical protein Ancab_029185 [Ancistrocladus abbreviatus]